MALVIENIEEMGDRIREERLRLGKSQTDFASFGGVSRGAQVNYESGERRPDTLYLQGVAENGADCQYIITGVRSLNMRDVERAGMDSFLVEYPPLVKLHKDIDAGLLASILGEVIRACEAHSELRDATPAEMAATAVQMYVERTEGDHGKLEATLIATLAKKMAR